MESTTGILVGKIAFYVALLALAVVLIIKKRKQSRNLQNREKENIKP
jgi:hypothetical protein